MKEAPKLSRRRYLLLQLLAVSGWSRNAAAVTKDVTAEALAAPDPIPKLAAMIVALYPHASLPPSIYQEIARTLLAKATSDPATEKLLNDGLAALDADPRGPWLSLSEKQRATLLQGQPSTPFFQFVRGNAAFLLYTRPDVWKIFGYGGDAWSFGGYSRAQVNSIDWLPDPKPAP
jgi:hypothetical protein